MRRTLRLFWTALLAATIVIAAAEHGAESGEAHVNVDLWKTVNFAILAIGLGWLLRKFAGKFFEQRTIGIQQGIAEATRIRSEAEARGAEMDRRMASLGDEIESLRSRGREEMAAEAARLREETERIAARMRANAEQEIASATKQARQELRAFSAELALKLARQKVTHRMTPEVGDGLVDSLVTGLRRTPRSQG